MGEPKKLIGAEQDHGVEMSKTHGKRQKQSGSIKVKKINKSKKTEKQIDGPYRDIHGLS